MNVVGYWWDGERLTAYVDGICADCGAYGTFMRHDTMRCHWCEGCAWALAERARLSGRWFHRANVEGDVLQTREVTR